jgi:hypothetical protein
MENDDHLLLLRRLSISRSLPVWLVWSPNVRGLSPRMPPSRVHRTGWRAEMVQWWWLAGGETACIYPAHELGEGERGENHLHIFQIKPSNKFDQRAVLSTLLVSVHSANTQILVRPTSRWSQWSLYYTNSINLRITLEQYNREHSYLNRTIWKTSPNLTWQLQWPKYHQTMHDVSLPNYAYCTWMHCILKVTSICTLCSTTWRAPTTKTSDIVAETLNETRMCYMI